MPRGRGAVSFLSAPSALAAMVLDEETNKDEGDTLPLTRWIPSLRNARVVAVEPEEVVETEDRGEFDPIVADFTKAAMETDVAQREVVTSGSRIELPPLQDQEEDTARGGEDVRPMVKLDVSGSEMEEISMWVPKSLTMTFAPILPLVGIRKFVFPEDAKKLDAIPLPSQFNYSVAHYFTALQGVLRSGQNAIEDLAKESVEYYNLSTQRNLHTSCSVNCQELSGCELEVSNSSANVNEPCDLKYTCCGIFKVETHEGHNEVFYHNSVEAVYFYIPQTWLVTP
ncbi:uncharacterized protein LOC120010387 [Tripterygium wilfordii]|uniref:uncharacterized protein LOC120010387 n=1 Tax=Tripterygium wilfordii TaxID=458696 RepID=UPI0018F82A15|nr:uncharacterized protein LOC120010387 [Tripterygium wilfordii]